MALRTAVQLSGDNLTIDDVWAVAVDRAPAALSGEARDKVVRARELVERAAHGTNEHTYGINTGFGRFVSRLRSAGWRQDRRLGLSEGVHRLRGDDRQPHE